MKKFLQRWKERKQNNRGASLVLVVSIVAIIGFLIVALLSITLMTFKMKHTYLNSQKNFYSAESVVDDINIGLQKVVSDAAGTAYAWTLENYSTATEAERKAGYLSKFEETVLTTLEDTSLSNRYSKKYKVSALQAMVSSDVSSQAKTLTIEATENALNVNPENGTYTIKNLHVQYTDSRNYMTDIQTDIVLSCPQIDFAQKTATTLDLTSFALVADQETKTTGGTIRVDGSAYLGTTGGSFDATNITFGGVGAGSRLITSGTIHAYNGTTFTSEEKSDIWAKNVLVEGNATTSTSLNGNTYLNNDLVLGNHANVTATGALYAYGNTDTATVANDAESVKNTPANYSSAILINGSSTTLNMSGLQKLWVCGNAYVNAEKNPTNNSAIDGNKDILMGESISLKSNQRAYLVPAEFIAPFCAHGGRNPMVSTEYSSTGGEIGLVQELCDKLGYTDESQIQPLDYVRASAQSAYGVPAELAQYGVTGIQKEIYPMLTASTEPISMVYFFLVFDSEDSANKFADSYYAKEQNLSSLVGRLDASHYNTSIAYPDAMETAPDNFTFYYNGSILVPNDADTKVLSGKLNQLTTEESSNIRSKEADYQNTFMALSHKLVTDSAFLTEAERQQTVFQNLVGNSIQTTDVNKAIGSGNIRVFATEGGAEVAEEAKMCAVVANGDYTITKEAGETQAMQLDVSSHQRLPVHVVIASGNVTVNCDYNGLIIAGGTITIANQNITIKADSNLAQQALRIKDEKGVRAADYLINGDAYLIDGAGASGAAGTTISFAEYVTYNNWSKQ